MSQKMHADEVLTDVSLVRRLLAAQFPQWANLSLEAVRSSGTDNAIYRLGEELVVRLPRIHWAVGQIDKEVQWLPRFAPHLPLAIPTPLTKGEPAEGYPWHWSVYRWIEGDDPTPDTLIDLRQAAKQLAHFIQSLQEIDTTGGPLSGDHNSQRGMPLAARDTSMRAAIALAHHLVSVSAVTKVWEDALQIPVWDKPSVWVHGDIQAGNLLAVDGRLNAVIDFGCLGVGDPAVDLIVAWSLLDQESRSVFRNALSVDDATWARGRAWALSIGMIALPYYQHTNSLLANTARTMINAVLEDYQRNI